MIHTGLQQDSVELADALEIWVILRQKDMGHIELRNSEAVFLKAGQQFFKESR